MEGAAHGVLTGLCSSYRIKALEWIKGCLRVFATSGTIRGTAYIKLTSVAPATTDSAEAQSTLSIVSVPRTVAGTTSTIISLAVTTECDPLQRGSWNCRCLPGYWWNNDFCANLQACEDGGIFQPFVSILLPSPCQCLRWTSSNTGYCQSLFSAWKVSESSTLPPKQASVGANDDLTLSFSLGEGATNVKWYLLSPERSEAKAIRTGTEVMLVQSSSKAVLTVSSPSPDWAGEYICRYWNGKALQELRQKVTVPLVAADIVQTLSQVSMNCSSPDRVSLQCCIRNRGVALNASWTPGAPNPVNLVGSEDPLCHSLVLDSCPSSDTMYQCTFEGGGLGSTQTTVALSVIQDGDLFCAGENLQGRWNVTKAGRVAEILCPEGREGMMLRSCFSNGTWGAVQNNCTSKELRSTLREAQIYPALQLLRAGLGSPESEIPFMIEWLKMEMMPSHNQQIYPMDLLTLVITMDVISQVAMDSNMRLDSTSVTDLLDAVNWMLDLDPETTWSEVQARRQSTGSMFLQAIEGLTSLLIPPAQELSFTLPNLELQSSMFNLTWVDDFTKTFDTDPPLCSHISREELEDVVQREHNIIVSSLVLKNMDRILPGHYGADSSHVLGSLLMFNTITPHNGSVRQVDIEMMFGLWNTTRNMEEKLAAQCVFWDHSLLEGIGGWSSQGCRSSSTEMVANCSCQRLASFSVLMSSHLMPDSFALTVLSNFGVCVTILTIAASLLIYCLVWTSVVKNKISCFRYTTLVNISFSLLMGSLWFLGVSRASHENKLCVAVAFFTHFFYLAVFFWKLVQALILCHQLILDFHHPSIRTAVPAMVAVGYVCPLVLAGATVAAFFPRQSYLQETTCWLSFRSKAIYAFCVPILVILTVNLLILFVVLLKLMRRSEGPQGEEKKALLSIFKALLILTPVFGVTWVLGIITMTAAASQSIRYAFAILNSLQGLFVLVFVCLMDKEVWEALQKRRCWSRTHRINLFQIKE
ncbi:adhesion G-protein coupled receptor F3 [Heteronotia binoei]|uniref:adhesion G-protein coupled receptor F3 n=1 Tax=Heteronotia binoei TaxID=13085 RepID=UPI0029302FC9|nr:adhesion G-protein coupled receptor F3 [Heteronotia binoei]